VGKGFDPAAKLVIDLEPPAEGWQIMKRLKMWEIFTWILSTCECAESN
jgi:hypothetical protein